MNNQTPADQSLWGKAKQKFPALARNATLFLVIAVIICLALAIVTILFWVGIFSSINYHVYKVIPISGLSGVITFLLMAAFVSIPFAEIIKAFFWPLGNRKKKRQIRAYTFLILAGIFLLIYVITGISGCIKEITTTPPPTGPGITQFAPVYEGKVTNKSNLTLFLFVSPDNSYENMSVVYVLKSKTDTTISLREGEHCFTLLNTDGQSLDYHNLTGLDGFDKKFDLKFNGQEYEATDYYKITVSQENWLLTIDPTALSFKQIRKKSKK